MFGVNLRNRRDLLYWGVSCHTFIWTSTTSLSGYRRSTWLSNKWSTKFIGRQKRFISFFFNSQCINPNGRTFILLIKKCQILYNSMLSLEFGSLGILDFQCFKVSYFAFSLNLSNSGELTSLAVSRILSSPLVRVFTVRGKNGEFHFHTEIGAFWSGLLFVSTPPWRMLHFFVSSRSVKAPGGDLSPSRRFQIRLSSLRKSNETWLLSFAGVWTFLIVLSFLW